MKLSSLAVVAAASVTAEAAFVGPSFAARPMVGQLRQRPSTSPSCLNVATEKETTPVDQATLVDGPSNKATTMNKDQVDNESFENQGLFWWMTNFLFLHEDGKSMAYGMPVDANNSQKASPGQVAQQKQEFADNLMNIGMEERERRRNAGKVFTILTGVYVVWASLIADQGDLQGHILRFLSFLPLFFASGYQKSAEAGL